VEDQDETASTKGVVADAEGLTACQQGSLVAFDPEDDRSPQGASGER